MGWHCHQLNHMQIICNTLQTDNHASIPSLNFLQAGCSSWCPTNRVKALKAVSFTLNCKINYVHPYMEQNYGSQQCTLVWNITDISNASAALIVQLLSKIFNLCGHDPPTSQTDGQMDRQMTCDSKTALCTVVHRVVKSWRLARCCFVDSEYLCPQGGCKWAAITYFLVDQSIPFFHYLVEECL